MQKIPGPITLLSSAWGMLKAHSRILITIAAIPTASVYIGQLFLQTKNPLLVIIGILIAIVSTVLSIAMQPALILTVQKLSVEPTAVLSAKEQYRAGFKFFWPIIGLGMLNALFVMGGLVALIIPAIVIGVYASLYSFSRVLDDKRGYGSFTDSFSLVRGRWWGVFGRLLFMIVIYIAVSLVVGGLLYLLTGGGAVAVGSATGGIVSGLLNLVMNCVLVPLSVVYTYAIYAALKSTRAPDAPENKFKIWLRVFTIVGILIPIMGIIFSIILVSLNMARIH